MNAGPAIPPASRPRLALARLAARAAVIAIALLIAAGLAEILVRIAVPGFPGFRVPQIEHRPIDGLGFEMVPNQTGYTTASRATINALGLRGPELRADRGPDGRRVLCLGDSITFGVDVEDDQPYPRQLERLLAAAWPGRPVEVINGGVQRYFTYQEIDQLRRLWPVLRPDVVTLGVYPNDIGERPAEQSAREYENERELAASSVRRRFPWFYGLVKNSAAVELAKNAYLSRTARESTVSRALEGTTHPRDEQRWLGFEQELTTFAQLARELRFIPIVVAVPARPQIRQDLPHSFYPQRVLNMSRQLGLTAVSPVQRFKDSLRAGFDPYLPWDDHLSPTGHRLVAETLRDEIARMVPAVSASH